MLNRRHMMFATAAAGFAATGGLPSLVQAREGEVAKLNALFDDIMAKQLRQSPETATGLGLDTGELAWTAEAGIGMPLLGRDELALSAYHIQGDVSVRGQEHVGLGVSYAWTF